MTVRFINRIDRCAGCRACFPPSFSIGAIARRPLLPLRRNDFYASEVRDIERDMGGRRRRWLVVRERCVHHGMRQLSAVPILNSTTVIMPDSTAFHDVQIWLSDYPFLVTHIGWKVRPGLVKTREELEKRYTFRNHGLVRLVPINDGVAQLMLRLKNNRTPNVAMIARVAVLLALTRP